MNLIIYSILTRLAIGSPLADDSADNYPTTTTVDSYPVSTPTNTAIPIDSYPVSIPTDITTPIDKYPVSTATGVVIPIYTKVSEQGYTGKPHPKWNHHHKHHHVNNKYLAVSPIIVTSYPVETSSAIGDNQSGSGSSNTPVYALISDIGYTNDSLNFNTDCIIADTTTTENDENIPNTSNDDATDDVTTNDVTNDNFADNINNTNTTTVDSDQATSSPIPLPPYYNQI